MATHTVTQTAPEARSGLDPWRIGELPPAPRPRGFQWINAVGPGVIVLGASIGSGEFLLGPAAFVKYGLSLLWVVGLAALLQTLLNVELMRYTMATGEPAVTGFMRTRPNSTFWAWFYAVLYFLQMGWPGWAGAAAGAVFFLAAKRLPGAGEAGMVYAIGVGLYLLCGLILLVGRRIERTLEYLNWIMITCIIAGLALLAILFVPLSTWGAALVGFTGFDVNTGSFQLVPAGVDFFLLGAFAAYAGGGGVANLTLSNWARDKGYGMSSSVGFIPAAVGGKKVALAHSGATFEPNAESLERWRGWWRIIRVDQWGVFFTGAVLGMTLPALLYVTFVPAGTDIRGLGIAAALAQAVATQKGAIFGGAIAILGVWILFKAQLDILEGMTRAVTDILWTGSARIRAWRGGDVRVVYYSVLVVISLWENVRLVALEVKTLLEEMDLRGWPKTSGSRGMHVNVRIQPRWTFSEVRRAAVALSREIERRLPKLASSKWWKEERHGVFLDYNQNAKDRTTCSAYSVRPLPDARVSTPLDWDEVADCDPADFTVLTVPQRFAQLGDPHAEMDAHAGSLEKLLELADRDEAAGLGDAPWPPHFRKMEGEGTRVAPSRARSAGKKPAAKKKRTRMPLIVVANSPDKKAALEGLERWKAKHPKVAKLLAVDDVLVDSMRGRSSTWTRIRVNLRNVPEKQRPPQETPDPDDDPTREWREAHRKS